MKIGSMQFLKIARFSAHGAYLADENGVEVLLPNAYVSDEMRENALVWAFIYTDSEDRLVATTETPKAFVGDIVALEVKDIAAHGAFLDFGLKKDIFLPCKIAPKIGQKIVVQIALDRQNRLIARQNFDLAKMPSNFKKKRVEILPFRHSNLGINCVIEGKFGGILHKNDINCEVVLGQNLRGIIKKIRGNGNADLGLENDFGAISRMLLARLENGAIPLNFKSSSEEIFMHLKISKKAFKTAAASLIKAKKARFALNPKTQNLALVLCV